jgi:hypothetical protein
LPINTLERAEAQNTPQAEILLSAIDALQNNEIEKFKGLTASNSEINFLLQGPNKVDYAASLLNYMPITAGKLRSSISKIVYFGDRASLIMQHPAGGLREFNFEKESGHWKLTQG